MAASGSTPRPAVPSRTCRSPAPRRISGRSPCSGSTTSSATTRCCRETWFAFEYLSPEDGRTTPLDLKPDPGLLKSYTERGIRSELRLPIRLQGERVGYLFFTSRRPNQYGEEDVALGRRIADHMALALSHERLAEEAKRAAQAQQQAARLQERVEELEGASSHRALGRSRKWKEVLAQAAKVAETDTTVL